MAQSFSIVFVKKHDEIFFYEEDLLNSKLPRGPANLAGTLWNIGISRHHQSGGEFPFVWIFHVYTRLRSRSRRECRKCTVSIS